jgi:diguanylate cyclase (GGDEF)-like protein/PAS domain S-box-containing protein
MKDTAKAFGVGAGLALLGVGLVEALLFAGLRPLAPIGWPGLATLFATALGGVRALAGGTLVSLAYYAANLGAPERFAGFYDRAFPTVSWIVGLAIMASAVLAARRRLFRAHQAAVKLAAAQAELAVRGEYEAALKESGQRLRLVTDNVPGLVAYIDATERYRFNNRAYEAWLGLERADITGRTVREVWGEELYRRIKPNLERALRGERVSHEYSLVHHGIKRHILASYVPDSDEGGNTKGFFVLGSDVTLLAAAQAELRAERERLEAALDGSSVAFWDTDLRSGRVYLSEAWTQIAGGPAGDTVTCVRDLVALMHPDDVEPAVRASVETMKGRRATYAAEHRVRAANGEWKWILSRGRVTERDPATGRAVRMIGTNVDITERKRLEEAVVSAAQIDPLTGVANRMLLSDHLQLAAARSRRNGTQLAVLYLDIDRFKEVNDTLGHAAGDALLKEFAMRLRACLRATDTVARLGGDEFVVLLEDLAEPGCAEQVAAKILSAVRPPMRFDSHEIAVTTSIGLACADAHAEPQALVRLADAALYEAKAAGCNTVRLARPSPRLAPVGSPDR